MIDKRILWFALAMGSCAFLGMAVSAILDHSKSEGRYAVIDLLIVGLVLASFRLASKKTKR
jgi:hypothetical protein